MLLCFKIIKNRLLCKKKQTLDDPVIKYSCADAEIIYLTPKKAHYELLNDTYKESLS